MKANYHTHTKRCQHAFGEDREYVEEAIRAGLRILGFSDHCPWIYKSDYVSNIRMTPQGTDGEAGCFFEGLPGGLHDTWTTFS